MAPTVSSLAHDKLIRAVAYDQKQVFEAGMTFARTEGIIAAPESCHAIKAAIDEALKAKKANEEKTIVFNLSGQGQLDLMGYADYLAGKI
jgi:tryptophan synthase beta chain